ncbi:MAG: class I SAM-dependent methyltransferase [Nanoarchaeota archaeon]|nr:class I SAM-dependent methyltransferase [Nanoarchaeota archaeon]
MKEVKIESRKIWEKQISRKDSVLDIGCWSGEKLLELLPKTKNGFGMDISGSKFHLANPKIRNKLKKCDITKKVPFKQKFDWIILGEVLEHVSDDEKALKNISNSLKKGGKLILTTPRSIKFFQIWDPAWFRWKFLKGQKHHHYTKQELIKKLKKKNLLIKEYYITGNFIWVLNRWINVILEYLLRLKKVHFSKEKKGFCDWIILAEKI